MFSEDLFNEWLEERAIKFGKKINTERSVKAARKKLEGWYNQGHNCDAIIEHAIEMGWRGLFLPTGFTPSQERLRAIQGNVSRIAKDLVSQARIPRALSEHEKQIEADRRREAGKRALEARRALGLES
jgi:hypothetical protein